MKAYDVRDFLTGQIIATLYWKKTKYGIIPVYIVQTTLEEFLEK